MMGDCDIAEQCTGNSGEVRSRTGCQHVAADGAEGVVVMCVSTRLVMSSAVTPSSLFSSVLTTCT